MTLSHSAHSTMPITWPPAYTVRHSARAQRVRLRITPQHGLEIIAPLNFKAQRAPALLQQHRAWITKHWPPAPSVLTQPCTAPTFIELAALEQCWQIHYEATAAAHVYLRAATSGELILQGNVTHFRQCQLVLCNWLRQRAAATLLPWLAELSQATQLTYRRGKIGNATTRWGSCSHGQDIMLNWHLLFLAKPLARHVIIHELCHTVHLDHSARFWQLVAQHDPSCAERRRQLKTANRSLPTWLGIN